MDNRTAWIYDPFYFSRIYPNVATGGGLTTSGHVYEIPLDRLIARDPIVYEELRCEYCGRKHGRGKETCAGCGAPL